MDNLLGYLGPAGTYSEEAAKKYCQGKKYLLKPFPTIIDIFSAVANKMLSLGVVPVENSLEGSINITFDLFPQNDSVKIKGELLLDVEHYLLAPPGQKLEEISEVYSHPQALAQCRIYLKKTLPGAVCTGISSTAEAASLAARSKGKAVIASRHAARLYGLNVLQANIQDSPLNSTRFLFLALEDAPRTGNDKTSLLIGLHDRPGSLYSVLKIFAHHNLNLTKIESRPAREKLGKYIFFLDIEGHREDFTVARALKEVQEKAIFIKILGSYPRFNQL